jgi:hypothetical protein
MMSAVQPCDFARRAFVEHLVFNQPTTCPPPLVHSVRLAPSGKSDGARSRLMCVISLVAGSHGEVPAGTQSAKPRRMAGSFLQKSVGAGRKWTDPHTPFSSIIGL